MSAEGERCASRDFLEIDHRHARALGGGGEIDNLRVLCRPHNRLAAEMTFGRAHIERRIHFRRGKSGMDAPAGAPRAPREIVRAALRSMGFRSAETETALGAMAPSEWGRPLEALLRDALGRLTPA